MSEFSDDVVTILRQLMTSAANYYRLTGKPIGITGEVGEYWAATHLNLILEPVRSPGYDAIDGRKVQIKSRLIKSSRHLHGRMGAISLKHEWDTVMLVLMEKEFEPFAIYEVTRTDIIKALSKTNANSRQRGQLAITEFKRLATRRWPEEALLPETASFI